LYERDALDVIFSRSDLTDEESLTEELTTNKRALSKLESNIRAKMTHLASENNLAPYEIPSRLLLITEGFSEQNGLLTSSFKVRRNQIYERYKQRIDALVSSSHQVSMDGFDVRLTYNKVVDQYIQSSSEEDYKPQSVKAPELTADNREVIEEDLVFIYSDIIRCAEADVEKHTAFTQLGGDSLTGVLFIRRVNQRYNLEVSTVVLLQNDFSISRFASYLISFQTAPSLSPLTPSKSVSEWQVEIDRLWNEDCSFFSREVDTPHLNTKRNVVFLTGATGFLGKHVLMELLSALSTVEDHQNIEYVCLVRCKDDSDGKARLLSALKEAMSPLNTSDDHWFDSSLSSLPRIRILRGDSEKEHFGLPGDEYYSLIERLKAVYHIASNTNTLLDYDSLRASNVLSTVTAMKLAYYAGRSRITLWDYQQPTKPVEYIRCSISPCLDGWGAWQ